MPKSALFAQKVYKKYAKSAVLRTFRHFSALFLESAETPLFVQINVFAVWPLRLDRKYTIQKSGFIRADFRDGDEDNNFSVFRVPRLSERPEPLH